MSLVSLWMPNGSLHKFLATYDDNLAEFVRLVGVCHVFTF